MTATRAAVVAAALLLLPGCPSTESTRKLAAPRNPDADSLYALGAWLARNLAGLKLEEADMAPLEEGLADALMGRSLRIDPKQEGERVQLFLNTRRAATAAEEKSLGAGMLESAAHEPGARRTVNGAIFLELAPGDGAVPTLGDQVKLHYRGTRRDGSVFDDSYARGKPGVFKLTGVIPCWMEALQQMKAGGKARVTCKSDLAYGDRGLPGKVLPGAPLQFELELLEILPAEAKP